MKRRIYSQLVEWKQTEKGKSALLIEGARRIGKSAHSSNTWLPMAGMIISKQGRSSAFIRM